MKTRTTFVILSIVMSSCMSYHCPTYDGSMGHTASVSSSKKSKPLKSRATSKKSVKQAEKD